MIEQYDHNIPILILVLVLANLFISFEKLPHITQGLFGCGFVALDYLILTSVIFNQTRHFKIQISEP